MLINKLSKILTFFLLIFSSVACADFFTWRNFYNFGFSTPDEACRNQLEKDWPDGYFTFSYSERGGDGYYKCIATLIGNGTNHFMAEASRMDGYCHPGKVFNPNFHACEVPPVDTGKKCSDQTGATLDDPLLRQSNGACALLSRSPNQNGRPEKEVACSIAGNPIDFSSGNKLQVELDYQDSLSDGLMLRRVYNSVDGVWHHNFSTNLRLGSDFIIFTDANGRESYFTLSDGIAKSNTGNIGRLQNLAGEWVYIGHNNDHYDFDERGRLIRIEYASGYKILVNYSDAQVIISDETGRSLTLVEGDKHQVLSASGTGLSASYQYNALSLLTQVTRTHDGQVETRKYHYEAAQNPRLLTGITDERGVRYATWTYDASGRGVSSEHAGGVEKVLISYNADGSSTVTNELGKKTVYRFQLIQGVKRIVSIEGEPSANCPASNSTFTYNDRGQVLTQTDAKGFITTYTYNDRGLETTRTQASGTPQARTTTTTWHATFNLPLTVTEGGQVTTYTYDTQGRQTSRTQAAL
ncbi:MAG: DUF6531 domain-containing protein [Pseudomonas sp.]|uniref:DUF6531 domain-containing protein n=1 Tax=Pseudomonas sp. TaxID=306 RepID=UPI0030F0781E